MASTDINLPRTHKAKFPDRCVVCGTPGPDSNVTLITGSIGWWTWLLWWFGSPCIVRAPACNHCSWRLHAGRFLSLVVTIVIVIASIWLIWPHFADAVPRAMKKWAMMGLAIVCLLPQIIYEVVYPKPFDITAFSNSVDYEFADEEFAFEFAALNNDAEWVKVEGVPVKQDRDEEMGLENREGS